MSLSAIVAVIGNRAANLLSGRISAILFLSAALIAAPAGQIDNNGPSKSANPAGEKATAQWLDSETGKILFSSLNIVRFDWEQQIFELDHQRVVALMSLPHSCNRRFIISDANGIIYHGGTLQSGLSSCAIFNGPTIITQIWSEANDGWLPLYQIKDLNDGSGRFKLGDGFLSQVGPRLKTLLEKGGLLGRINKDEVKAVAQIAATKP